MRIVLTGAESSGKSTLTTYLAEKFNLPYALEYARYHLEKHGSQYDLPQLINMSRKHLDFTEKDILLIHLGLEKRASKIESTTVLAQK